MPDRAEAARARFVATIFVGSFLLFQVQPMIGRMVLPRMGGAPAVWNSALLVYQALLLAGYAYAHWLARLAPRTQAALHLCLLILAGLMLPIGLIAVVPGPTANPFIWVPWLLLVSIGPLFFVVSAQAPLLQRWFVLGGGDNPYPLYAFSNLGSFAGLLSYPLAVEPMMPIEAQRWMWSAGYAVLVLLVSWCALALPQTILKTSKVKAPRPAIRTIVMWLLLAAVPSGLVLSTTLHLTTEIVAVPLLWVAPLAVYLLSFTIAFSSNPAATNAITRVAPVLLVLAAVAMFIDMRWLAVPIAVLNLFALSVALHGQLLARRPDPQQLTLFYLVMSAGGVLGGIFCALVAPMLFDWTYEHALLLVAAALLMTARSPFERLVPLWKGDSTGRLITRWGVPFVTLLSLAGVPAIAKSAPASSQTIAWVTLAAVGIVAIGNRVLFGAAVGACILCLGGWDRLALSAAPDKMMRSFFGVYQIRSEKTARMLVHGTTLHGIQNLGSPERERMVNTYYGHQSGVGMAFDAAPRMFGRKARIAVVGLGAGTLACSAQPGQSWTFYEIDPLVAAIATNKNQFTFLARCKPDAAIRIGDARILIERAPAEAADLLVIDAFTSDSVPVHLLTREAFAAYRRHLTKNGLLLVHISNRYLDLGPVLAAAARDGWHLQIRRNAPDNPGLRLNEKESHWVALSPSRVTLDRLIALSDSTWLPLTDDTRFSQWTDDHASILPLIKWNS